MTTDTQDFAGNMVMLPVGAIVAGENPRTRFDGVKLQALAESITKHGILEPIVVHPTSADGTFYEIIAGERRYRAACLAGLPDVPCVVRAEVDADALVLAWEENEQREGLDPIDRAFAIKRMCDLAGNQAVVEEKLGIDQSTISNAIRLTKLPEDVQEMVRDGKLNSSAARNLVPFAHRPEICTARRRARHLGGGPPDIWRRWNTRRWII